jgi:nucleotide-binding universal stress UspA family protein
MRPFRRILYATDFSRASTAALKAAVGMAKTHRGRLTILHVMAPSSLALGSNEWQAFQACIDGGSPTDLAPAANVVEEGPHDGVSRRPKMAASMGMGGGGLPTAEANDKKAPSMKARAEAAASVQTSCAICGHFLFLSCVRCSCCPQKASCLLHAEKLCACSPGSNRRAAVAALSLMWTSLSMA